MIKKVLSIVFLFSFFVSCEEEGEILKVNETVASNEIKELSATDFVLVNENAGTVFQEFEWSAPDFGFPASVSYTLQLDEAGNDFASPVDLLTTTSRAASLTVGDFNKKLLDLGLAPDEPATVELRVVSTVNPAIDPVYSALRTFSVTPYATNFPPIYMVGDATGGWDLAKAVAVRSIAPSVYETTAEFTNGGKFRFFASPSWDANPQYNWATFEGGTVGAELANGLDNDGNFLFNGATGWYRITADVKGKTLTMQAVERPALYMIGTAIKGWDLGQAVELERISDGVYQGTTTFTSGETFRFFTKPDWSAGTINYPYFADGDVDPLFENANDDDSNLKFLGTTGEYTITVDLNNLTVVMEVPGVFEPIYMIGDATGGWDLTLAVEVAGLGSGKYETVAAFTNLGKFRFFKTADWGAQQYTWSTFEGGTVDSDLQNGGDADGNFLFAGTSGSYKIIVDVPNKTIEVIPQ